jgi:hypothetical protein
MAEKLKTGAKVSWRWGQGEGKGEIAETFTKPVTRTIKGKRIRRKASEDEPAYLIRQADGDRVLKSHRELAEG